MNRELSHEREELSQLCSDIRRLAKSGQYDACREIISPAMGSHPDAPQPHNLLGAVLELEGKTLAAMKHYKAACALDQQYAPARINLERLAAFYQANDLAFDESDCPPQQGRIEYNTYGIGRIKVYD